MSGFGISRPDLAKSDRPYLHRTSDSRYPAKQCWIAGILFIAACVSASHLIHAATLPIQSSGFNNALNLAAGDLLFDTDTGVYYINSVAQNTPATAIGFGVPANNAGTTFDNHVFPTFDFTTINLGPAVTVHAIGKNPFAILATGSADIGATFLLSAPLAATAL